MIKISKRLKVIADLVHDNSHIVDIGCDHALLDIYLYQLHNNISIIASDINKNALENAKKNIKKYKLDNYITTVLSNGLDNIDTSNLDTIIISGMGAHTIVGILYNNLKKIKKIDTIIIESNNNIDFLRYKLSKIDYYIEDEKLVKDADIIYTVIKFKKGHKFYSKKELYFGPILLREKNDLFVEKCSYELEKINKFYHLIPSSNILYKQKVKWRIKEINKIIRKNDNV